jgi:murein DD-endopeptidase MepM/ murein hydrolase activator NlpD
MIEDASKQQIIGIQQFKHLVSTFVSEEEALEQTPVLESFDTQEVIQSVKEPSIIVKAGQRLRHIGTGFSAFAFIIQLYNYIFVRIRVVFVLFSVALELINNLFEGVKRKIIRNLFWGRGYLFRFSFQLVVVLILFIMLLSSNYRSIWAQRGIGVAGRPVYASNLPDTTQQDVIVQNSTTRTISPEDRTRLESVQYVVKDGDSLSNIAKFFSVSVETLMWANNLSSATLISPGQSLVIPPGDGVLVTVGEGDSLDGIASKYSSNTQLIADANLLDPPFSLVSGTQLFVPDGRPPVPVNIYTFSGVVRTAPAPNWSSSYVDPEVGRFVGWPVAGGRGLVTQCPSAWHDAVDIADGGMPDLVAAADGVVNFAGCHSGDCPAPGDMVGGSGAAWAVEIDHQNGYTTLYAHMYKIYVTAGEYVTAGTPIGQMGMTGAATGIHVHFELWQGRKWNRVDPTAYMSTHICGY